MSEKHSWENDDFRLDVHVTNDGEVEISFHESGKCVFSLEWDTFSEVLDFIGMHGLAMKDPWFVDRHDPASSSPRLEDR